MSTSSLEGQFMEFIVLIHRFTLQELIKGVIKLSGLIDKIKRIKVQMRLLEQVCIRS